MLKQKFLFILLGVFIGFVGGFTFANSVNRSEATQGTRAAAAVAGGGAANSARADGTTQGGAHPPTAALPSNAVKEQGGGMQQDVQAALERAKREPNDFDAQQQAAEMYYLIQRYEPALGYLQRAHELRPDSYEIITRLGNVNFYLERYDKAGEWYTQALAARADDAGVRSDLGLTYYLRGDIDRAIAEYKQTLTREPQHEQALQNLTIALRDKKNLIEARQTLARLEAAHPQNESLARLRESLSRD
jgi:tetratricopeptide (TPR) repeat protein